MKIIFLGFILFFSSSVLAGGGFSEMFILEILSETESSMTFKVKSPIGYARPVAISERAAVKGKKKAVSIVEIKYETPDRIDETKAEHIKNKEKKKARFLKSFSICKRGIKRALKQKKLYKFVLIGGFSFPGYGRTLKIPSLIGVSYKDNNTGRLIDECLLMDNRNN